MSELPTTPPAPAPEHGDDAPASVLDAQVQSLLELVERHRREQCEQLQAGAQARRSELLHQAHTEARQRAREAIEAERRRARQQLAATRAQLQTRARQQQHKTALLMLHQGWELLGTAVLQRWKNAPQRRQWVHTLLNEALRTLPRCSWVIEHPPGWESAECAELQEALRQHCGEMPRFSVDGTLHAGLRVCAAGACLDGTLEGLLADRTAIEAQLLAQLNRLLSSNGGSP